VGDAVTGSAPPTAAPVVAPEAPAAAPAPEPAAPLPAAAEPVLEPAAPRAFPGAFPGGGDRAPATEAARSLTALGLLAGLIALFLLAQGRFSRGDARLLEAPVESERREFRWWRGPAQALSVPCRNQTSRAGFTTSDGMAMTRARRTIGQLVVLSGALAITLLLVPTPAPARAAPPPLGLPPLGAPLPPLPPLPLPPLPLPPLPALPLPPAELSQVEEALTPVAGALDEPLASVEPLVTPAAPAEPAAPAPAVPAASLPPAVASTPPGPASAPPAPGGPGAAGTAGAAGAPTPPPRPALPTAEPVAADRGPAAAIVRAARSFTPLFVLAAAVVAFLVVQGRVDRRDAKLATAPVASDVLEFRW
jgi:hypothetical protein